VLKIAYLGPEKTNTYFAARKKFGSKAHCLHAPTVEKVFQLVERREADFGVAPIENSLEGSVTHTLDQFIDFKNARVRIYGEIEIPIQHYWIMVPGVRAEEIREVYSHPQALAQCSKWLNAHFPKVKLRETDSTAQAVAILQNGSEFFLSTEIAAIARRELAEEHALRAIRILTDQKNRTRFLILSLRTPSRGRKNKTSLMFALKDKPGALHDALLPFKDSGINLTRIESRPSGRKAWEYLFFIDLEGHESEPQVQKALRDLRASTASLRILGSYPRGGSRGRG
jgi:chorismate mutase / prephenate dehydratase